jgi:hypothetical protein
MIQSISVVWCRVGRGPVLGLGINYTGPSSYKKRIYRAAVSQRLRTTGVGRNSYTTELKRRMDAPEYVMSAALPLSCQ